MKSFKQFCEDFSDPKMKARNFLNHITTSSRMGQKPDQDIVSFLSPTSKRLTGVDMTGLVSVYRGLNLNHLDSSTKDGLKSLKAGMQVPKEFERPNTGQVLIHTTTDKEVAKKYAGEGCNMMFEMQVPAHFIICDTSGLREVFEENDFSPHDWDYFDNESEVMVDLDSLFDTIIHQVNA